MMKATRSPINGNVTSSSLIEGYGRGEGKVMEAVGEGIRDLLLQVLSMCMYESFEGECEAVLPLTGKRIEFDQESRVT